jgi:hypothetical protein
VKRFLLGCAILLALVGVPTAVAAATSPTVRLAIVHVVRGCHAWGTASSQPLGPSRTLSVRRGTKLEIRVNCPMSFQLAQVAGPRLNLGDTRMYSGTVRTIVFARKGVYKLTATNVETSEQVGLQTLGPDNVLSLTVTVR